VLSPSPAPLPLYAQQQPSLAEAISFQAPDPLQLETEIYYALHRLKACLGETVEVFRSPGNAFQVRGVVVDSDRKDQLLAGLAPLTGPLVTVDIKSVQEAIQEIGPAVARPTRPVALPAMVPRKEVLRSLAGRFPDSEAAARFVDAALSSSEDVMREAQALRRLAELSRGVNDTQSPQTRWLLQVMTYDHIRDLQTKLEATEQLVRPPLVALAGSGSAQRASSHPTVEGSDGDFATIFNHSKHLNDRLRALFDAPGTPFSADRLMQEILEAFPPLQASIRAASEKALALAARGKEGAAQ
jgi:hypothetical protein